MKFATAILSAVAAVAVSAQDSSNAPSSTITQAASTTTSLSPTQTCLNACSAGDVTCQAACVNVPAPDASAVNATTECAAACDQGDGSAADTEAYAKCQAACYTSLYYSAGAAATATGASGAATNSAGATATATGSAASGSGSAASGSSGSSASASGSRSSASSATGSSSGSASSSSSTADSGAGAIAPIGMTGLGGVLLAIFAL